MGLYLRKELKNGAEISVWEVTETEEDLLKIISIQAESRTKDSRPQFSVFFEQ